MEAQMLMQIPVFNGEDHEIWSIKMRTLLMARDLWDVVESGIPDEKPSQCIGEWDKRQKDLRIKDMTALHMLHRSVTESMFFRIGRATSSKQAWELLKAEFGETKEIQSRKMGDLMSEYYPMKMSDEENFHEYIGKLMEVANRLKFYGENIPDHKLIQKILSGLPPRFLQIILSIRDNIHDKKFTLSEVVYILQETESLNEEALRNQKTSESYSNNKRGRR